MANQTRKGRPTIPLLPVDKGSIRDDRTRELTGADASIDEAEIGDAGNGADPYGADLSGGLQHIEDEPAGEDIQPDEVRRFPRGSDEDERKERSITAQPNDPVPEDPSEVP